MAKKKKKSKSQSRKASRAGDALIQQRQIIFGEMTPALQKMAEKFQEHNSKELLVVLKMTWGFGQMVAKAMTDEKTYGNNAVEQLSAYTGLPVDEFHGYRRFFEVYTPDQLEALAARRMASGRHISFAHAHNMMKLANDKDRTELWAWVFSESVSSRDLAREITARGLPQNANRHGGGRKPSVPGSLVAGLQQVFSKAKNLNNCSDVWRDAVLRRLREVDAKRVNVNLVARLIEADVQLSALEANVVELREGVKTGLDRAKKLVDSKEAKVGKRKKAPVDEPELVGTSS